MTNSLVNLLQRRPALVAPLLLAAILLMPFASVLLRPAGRVLGQYSCDNPSMFYFINDFAGQARRDGEIPLWNPDIMLGLPFVGEGQAAVFHPLSSLFAWLPTGVAINWLCALCLLAAGLSFYGYMRALDVRRDAALCAAAVWGLSSIHTSRIYAGHLSILLGLFCWPLMLMWWERFRRGGQTAKRAKLANLAGLSVTYACLILAAHPQSLYICSLFMLLYVVVELLMDGVGRDQLLGSARRIGWLGAFVLLGVGLAAVQLLPSYDFARNSFRASSTYEFCTTFSFPPENFLTLLCPRFFGSGSAGSSDPYWGRNYPWEMWLYVGILPLAAALTGLLRAPRRNRITLLACGLVFLLIGLGSHTPLYRVLYDFAPFFDTFRSPSKNLQVTMLCLTALAGFGFQSWFEGFGGAAPRVEPPPRRAERRQRPTGRARESSADAPRAVPPGRWTFVATLGFALLLLALVVWMYLHYVSGAATPNSAYRRFMNWRYAQGEIYLAVQSAQDSARVAALAAESGRQLVWAIAFALLSVAALALLRWTAARRIGAAIVLPLLLVDLGVFTAGQLPTFEESRTRYAEGILAALNVPQPPSAEPVSQPPSAASVSQPPSAASVPQPPSAELSASGMAQPGAAAVQLRNEQPRAAVVHWGGEQPGAAVVHSGGGQPGAAVVHRPVSTYPTRIHDSTTYPNKAMSYGLSSLGGYSGNTLPRYNAYVNRTQGYRPMASQAQARFGSLPPIYRMLAIDRLIAADRSPPPGAAIRASADGRVVTDFPGAFARVLLAAAPRAVDGPDAALDYVAAESSDPFASPCVETHAALPPSAPLTSDERADIREFRRNRVEVAVHAAAPRLLVLNEMYYKDWTATVNGAAAEVLPANYLFRGVIVPAGDSTVVFEFRSAAFRWGARVTILSLVLLAGAVTAGLIATNRRRLRP